MPKLIDKDKNNDVDLKIKTINDQQLWENFVEKNNHDTFLQSWEWGEFNLRTGNPIWRLGVYSGDKLNAVCLVIKISARRGKFLFVPHGPIVDPDSSLDLKTTVRFLKTFLTDLCIKEGASFLRIAPVSTDSLENRSIFLKLGFRDAPIHMHSELCWVLDIRPDEELLLKNMRKTTRYLIKKSFKDKIIIKTSEDVAELKQFNKLYKETEQRHNFVAFSSDYLKNEFLSFKEGKKVKLYFAYFEEKLLSTALVVFLGKTGFYHHGASISYNNIPASYLLHWIIICDLKDRGYCYYNFWGISPEDKKNHPWRGLTLFKKGFGGEAYKMVRTQDFIISWRSYLINWLIETARKIKRGF